MRFCTLAITILLLFGNFLSTQAQPWIQVGGTIYGENAGDQSGWSVALSADGNTVAIGSRVNSDSGYLAGHVRIFRNVEGNWVQIGNDIDGQVAGDQCGWSLSLSDDGNTIAVGEPLNDEGAVDGGQVRVFQYSQESWIQIGNDYEGSINGGMIGLGSSVCLSGDGNRLAFGIIDQVSTGWQGRVYIRERAPGGWVTVGNPIIGEQPSSASGWSVSLNTDGSVVAIGAIYNNGGGFQSGSVRVHQFDQGSWIQIGQDMDGESTGDWSGHSMSLSSDGNKVAIGAYRNDGNGTDAGHVRVYENNQGTWTQIGQDIDGEAAEDESGTSVSLSADGSVVIVGAPFNDGNGVDAGHARVYVNNQGNWVQIGGDIDGEVADDRAGNSVSTNADGSIVAVSSYLNDGNGLNSGCVRIYKSGGMRIEGKVYQDGNLNGDLDQGELALDGQIIQLSAVDGSTKYRTTTVNGEYYFALEDTGIYEVSYNPPINFIESSGNTSVVIQAITDTLISDVNFGVGYTDTIVDIQVDVSEFAEWASPLVTFQVWSSVANLGTVSTNYSTLIATDALTTVTNFNQSDSVIQPGQLLTDVVTLSHASNLSTSSISTSVISVSDLGIEIATNDNIDSTEINIQSIQPCCPYDPNDKTVFGAYCEANYVEIGDTLEYRIRFMNTGTAPANTVVLIDTLDASVLDLRTFRVIGHSHPMYWDISGPGKLTITYPDINLPDSSVSFLGSQGFFKFRIVMRDTVSNLTQSGSSAFIYFDNEAPIETNEPTIIAVDSIPVSELTATDAICGGESGLIDASISFGIGADSAYWGNGSTGLPLPYNDEDTYTVELVDEYGCRYLDSIAVSCNILTSIDENGEEFSVYPNPSNGKYYVNAKGNVRVFDVSGKEVYRTSSFNAPTEVDLSALPSGIYTIQLTNKGGVFTGKLVRE